MVRNDYLIKSWEIPNIKILELNIGQKINLLDTSNPAIQRKLQYIDTGNQKGYTNILSISKFPYPFLCSSLEQFIDKHYKKIGKKIVTKSPKNISNISRQNDSFIIIENQKYNNEAEFIKKEYYEGGSEAISISNISLYEGFIIGTQCNELFQNINEFKNDHNNEINLQHPSGAYYWLNVKKTGKRVKISYSTSS
ncbi:hypothetical protein [Leptospira meyeri]|uniref:hypothetical protein n=1 Tax=Leptospira meyeri TaxID=29508 RepID=UPI0012F6FE16|nr:hypothetical protein [Leptospira meyeri]